MRFSGQQGFSGKRAFLLMYGFHSRLSEDYQIFTMLRKLRLIPFFQEYMPLPGLPARVLDNFFDFDLDRVIRLTFRSNGMNWEKYLRWLNRHYFSTFGRYYYPLVEIKYDSVPFPKNITLKLVSLRDLASSSLCLYYIEFGIFLGIQR